MGIINSGPVASGCYCTKIVLCYCLLIQENGCSFDLLGLLVKERGDRESEWLREREELFNLTV